MDIKDIRAQADSTCPAMERSDGRLKCPVCGAEGLAGERLPHKDGCALGKAIEDAMAILDKPDGLEMALRASLATVPPDKLALATRLANNVACASTDAERGQAVDGIMEACPGFSRRMADRLKTAAPSSRQLMCLRMALAFELGIADKERQLMSRLAALKGDVTSAFK